MVLKTSPKEPQQPMNVSQAAGCVLKAQMKRQAGEVETAKFQGQLKEVVVIVSVAQSVFGFIARPKPYSTYDPSSRTPEEPKKEPFVH